MKSIGRILFYTGILFLLFGFYLIWQRNNPARIAFKNTTINSEEETKIPTELVIDSQKIDLPVIEGEIINQGWTVTDKGVSVIGNVYYGHNWTNLLGNLVKVKPGDIIEIKYSNGKSIKYSVTVTQVVDPDQKDVLNLANDNSILIYTCTGFLDSKRFVVVASKI